MSPERVTSNPILAAFRRRFVRNPEVTELTPFGFFEAGWKACLDAAEVPSQEARQQAAERAVQAGIVLSGPMS